MAFHSSLSPLRGAQREVITLSPNRKPHQKRIMFLHKPVNERAAKPDGDQLLSITDAAHTHGKICLQTRSCISLYAAC